MEKQQLTPDAEGIAKRAKAIITAPGSEWPVIAQEKQEPMQVFLKYAVPLAAIGPIATLIGSLVFGYSFFGVTYRPGIMSALGTAITSYVLSLVSLWIVSWVANFLAPKFGGKDEFPSAFKLVAYAMTASWLAGIFGLVPALSILSLVGLYSIYLFYKGSHPLMGVPEDKGVIYTVATVAVAFVVSLVVGLVTTAIAGVGSPDASDFMGSSGDSATIDLGGYGEVSVDGERQVIDMGEMGRMEIDPETGEARIEVDGQEMTVSTKEAPSE